MNFLKAVVMIPGALLAVAGILFALVGVGLTGLGKYLLALADD